MNIKNYTAASIDGLKIIKAIIAA